MMLESNMIREDAFCDERINYESGRIYRRGILLAVLYTVLFTVSRLLFTGGFSGITHYLTEGTMILSGAVILLVGWIRWGFSQDERSRFEAHRYYLTAGKVFLVLALAGYAISIPFRVRADNDYPVNELILHLEALGCVYFFYSFKRCRVSFNYTFIHERGWRYFRRVLLNIAKLAGILLIPYGIAALLDLWLYGSVTMYVSLIFGYIYSTVGLGLDYFLLSLLEKLNYDEDRPRGMKKGTFVAFLVAVILQAGVFICQILASVTAEFSMTLELPLGMTVGTLLAAATYAAGRAAFPALISVALALCLLMEQTQNSKWVRWGICGFLTVQSADLVLGMLRTSVLVVLERYAGDGTVVRQFADLASFWSFAVWLISLAFTCLWIHGVIRDCGASRFLWATVALVAVCQVLGIFFGTQSMPLAHTLVMGGGALLAMVARLIILKAGNLRTVDCDPE